MYAELGLSSTSFLEKEDVDIFHLAKFRLSAYSIVSRSFAVLSTYSREMFPSFTVLDTSHVGGAQIAMGCDPGYRNVMDGLQVLEDNQ